jgi:hypothetical protein
LVDEEDDRKLSCFGHLKVCVTAFLHNRFFHGFYILVVFLDIMCIYTELFVELERLNCEFFGQSLNLIIKKWIFAIAILVAITTECWFRRKTTILSILKPAQATTKLKLATLTVTYAKATKNTTWQSIILSSFRW